MKQVGAVLPLFETTPYMTLTRMRPVTSKSGPQIGSTMFQLFLGIFKLKTVKKVDKPGFFYIVALFLSIAEVRGSLVGPSDFKSDVGR